MLSSSSSSSSSEAGGSGGGGGITIDYSKFDALAKQIQAEEDAEDEEMKAKKQQQQQQQQQGDVVSSSSSSSSGKVVEDDENGDSDTDSESDLHPLFWTRMPGEEDDDVEMDQDEFDRLSARQVFELRKQKYEKRKKRRNKNRVKNEAYVQILSEMTYSDKSPAELSDDLRLRGNESFRHGDKRNVQNALNFYTDALEYCLEIPGDTTENRERYITILTNRAAVHLAKKNYGSARRDCAAAVKYGGYAPCLPKTYFRWATALLNLKRYKEAFDVAKKGLETTTTTETPDAQKKPLETLLTDIKTKMDAQDAIDRAKAREELYKQRKEKKMKELLTKKHVRLGAQITDLSTYGSAESMKPVFVEETGVLLWPCVIYYPEYSQTDFIRAFPDDCSIRDQLEVIFQEPAPWDSEDYYNDSVDRLKVFYESWVTEPLEKLANDDDLTKSKKKEWREVKSSKTLGQVLAEDGYIVPAIPFFYIVSTLSPFYKNWLMKIKD